MFKFAWGAVSNALGGIYGYLAIGGVCLILGSLGAWRVMSWREAANETKQAQATVRLITHTSQIITDLGAIYVPQFYAIQTETQKHIAEIPEHVTPQIDHDYPVPIGFVRVWDTDANSPVPPATAGSDADPSGVKLSDVAVAHATDAGNYETCRASLTEWWDWYDRNKAAWPK